MPHKVGSSFVEMIFLYCCSQWLVYCDRAVRYLIPNRAESAAVIAYVIFALDSVTVPYPLGVVRSVVYSLFRWFVHSHAQ
jgi:hypothetical protein